MMSMFAHAAPQYSVVVVWIIIAFSLWTLFRWQPQSLLWLQYSNVLILTSFRLPNIGWFSYSRRFFHRWPCAYDIIWRLWTLSRYEKEIERKVESIRCHLLLFKIKIWIVNCWSCWWWRWRWCCCCVTPIELRCNAILLESISATFAVKNNCCLKELVAIQWAGWKLCSKNSRGEWMNECMKVYKKKNNLSKYRLEYSSAVSL